MARAVTLRTTVWDGWMAACFAMGLGCLQLTACAGGGKDRNFSLPAGTEFDGARSDKVLVVVESQNQCDPGRNCVPAPARPCHLGQGNTRGVSLYRLGTTGLLFGNSAAGSVAEQLIATDDNPRALAVHPTDPTLVYVATNLRVQVIRLRSGGSSACIDETLSEQDVDPGANDLDPVDLLIDRTVGNGVLYVAGRGSNRIDAYAIEDDGTLPSVPTSCIVGGGDAEFSAMAPMSEGFFAAGGAVEIGVYPRVQGQFLPEPDPNASATPTPAPTIAPSPAPGETPGPSIPSPAPSTCIDARLVSTPLSTIGSSLVTDMFFAPSVSAPLGDLFSAEEASQRIFTFPVNADGVIDGNNNSQTKAVGVYQRMLRHQQSAAIVLYSSVFNQGRVDVFRLENGLLPHETFSRTAEDPNTLPVALTIDEPGGTILFVAQGGINRVDGFRIQPDGGLADTPVTSTAPPVDAAGDDISTFPDDVAIVPLP